MFSKSFIKEIVVKPNGEDGIHVLGKGTMEIEVPKGITEKEIVDIILKDLFGRALMNVDFYFQFEFDVVKNIYQEWKGLFSNPNIKVFYLVNGTYVKLDKLRMKSFE